MIRLFEPWPEPYRINTRSPYGPRKHPITRRVTFHHGVDVAMPIGTPLVAGADGTIAHKGAGASGGYTLLLRHKGNWHTVYYHLQRPSHRHVGERVKAGDLVAYSGNTGASTGPHLHFELRRSRQWGDTVDPVVYFDGKAQKPQEPVSRTNRRFPIGRPSKGLEGLSRSWVARGAHWAKRMVGR